MSFPAPSLDDRTFQQIVDEAKLLIPKYAPEWTNHNLSDPGVAIIELFAWMTEQVLYRLNQVPDRLYLKFLEMVGVSRFPAVPARADLTFWLTASKEAPPLRIEAGTQASTQQTERRPGIGFMTDHDLVIRQPNLTKCLTSAAGSGDYEDVWDDLKYEKSDVTCFPSNKANDALYLGFEESAAANVLYLEVEATALGVGIVPERPPLAWEAWDGERWAAAEIDPSAGDDSTGGLNRDGRVLIYMPFEHERYVLGTEEAYWVRARLTKDGPPPPAEGEKYDEEAEREAAANRTYLQSPRIRTLSVKSVGGRAHSTQGEPVNEELVGASDGEPGQSFHVIHTPVIAAPRSGRIRVADDPHEWIERDHFAESDEEARHFTWDRTTGEIRFGPEVRYPDGTEIVQHGRIPPRGAAIYVAPYMYGGGTIGNVGAGRIAVIKKTIPYVERVENRRKAEGGIDPETVDNAKKRGPLTLVTGDRAVNARDYVRLTEMASDRVARVFCYRPSERTEFIEAMRRLQTATMTGRADQELLDAATAVLEGVPSAVQVLVVPKVDIPPRDLRLTDLELSDELVETIGEYLDERRTLGTWIDIHRPNYVGVSVVAKIDPAPGHDHDAVTEACQAELYEFIDPLRGGPDGEGWPFGLDLNVGQLFQRLASVTGVEEVMEVALFEADEGAYERDQGKEAVDRLQLEPMDLFTSVKHKVVITDQEQT